MFRKSFKRSNFGCPSKLQNPIKFDVDKYVTSRSLFVHVYRTFYLILNSTCLFLQLSVYPFLHMTLSHSLPCNYPSLCYPTDLLYPLPDASDLPHSETCIPTFRKIILDLLPK